MKLGVAYVLVLESIGKISSNVPFIMPKRVAETDPFEQIKDYTGSGPFKFEAAEWRPGSKVVYTKFADYVPRSESPSAAAGGKVANVDRVEWFYFPDQQRSEEHTSELQSLMRISYAVFCLKKKKKT